MTLGCVESVPALDRRANKIFSQQKESKDMKYSIGLTKLIDEVAHLEPTERIAFARAVWAKVGDDDGGKRITSVEVREALSRAGMHSSFVEKCVHGLAEAGLIEYEAGGSLSASSAPFAEQMRAAAVDNQRVAAFKFAEREARAIGVRISPDGRVDDVELTNALRASGKTSEQRIAIRMAMANSGLID